MHSRKSAVMLFMDEGFYFYCCLVVVFVALLLLFLCCTLKVIYIFELWIYSNVLAINRSNISYLTVPYCGCVSSSCLESQVCDMRLAYLFRRFVLFRFQTVTKRTNSLMEKS